MNERIGFFQSFKETVRLIIKFLLKQLTIGMVITIVTLLVCYLLDRSMAKYSSDSILYKGYSVAKYYSDVLLYVGAAIAAIGMSSIMGTMQTSTDYKYIIAASTSQSSFKDRTEQNRSLINGAYSFCVRSVFIAAVPLAVGGILFSL